jgi:hypothetical protein
LFTAQEGIRALEYAAALTATRLSGAARWALTAGPKVLAILFRPALNSEPAIDGTKRGRALAASAPLPPFRMLPGPERRHTAIPRWLAVRAIVLIGLSALPAAQATSDEYRLKAAFVYRFPQFVEWPASAVEESRTVDLCVLQPNPFGAELERLVAGESLSGRPLRVRVVNTVDALQGCHALFAGARSEVAAAALKAVAGRPVLTVGENDEFLAAGGIIALKIVDRRVRFEVDATNAQKARLRISAQLLNLAAAIRGGSL